MKRFNFTINGNDYQVQIKNIDGNVAELEVNGTPYSVQIKEDMKMTKTPKLVRKEIQTKQGNDRVVENLKPVSDSKKPSTKSIKSPLPGSILKVNVKDGDTFKEGDVLMVMESMKMENNILAEKNGTIIKVCAPAGTSVLQDEVLFEID
jgi:biotin carboxyl carrier protein